jgi:hypothetical protein
MLLGGLMPASVRNWTRSLGDGTGIFEVVQSFPNIGGAIDAESKERGASRLLERSWCGEQQEAQLDSWTQERIRRICAILWPKDQEVNAAGGSVCLVANGTRRRVAGWNASEKSWAK